MVEFYIEVFPSFMRGTTTVSSLLCPAPHSGVFAGQRVGSHLDVVVAHLLLPCAVGVAPAKGVVAAVELNDAATVCAHFLESYGRAERMLAIVQKQDSSRSCCPCRHSPSSRCFPAWLATHQKFSKVSYEAPLSPASFHRWKPMQTEKLASVLTAMVKVAAVVRRRLSLIMTKKS